VKLRRFLLPVIPALLILTLLIPMATNAQSNVVYENWGRGLADGVSVRYTTNPSLFTDYGWSMLDTTAGCTTLCPTLIGSTTAEGGGFLRLIHAGSVTGDVRAQYVITLTQSATITVRVKTIYSYTVDGYRVRIGSSHLNSNMGGSAGQWKETTAVLSAGTHTIGIENIKIGSSVLNNTMRWDIDAVEILGIPAEPPPPPPLPPVDRAASCHVVYNASTREIYTSTLSLDDAQAVFFATGGSVATQSVNLLANGDFEIADGDRPRNWIWNQPFYAGGMYVTDPDPDYNKIIRRNGSPGGATPLMAGDETPETAGDTLSSGGIVVELSQNVNLPPSDNYQLSADVRVEGGGLILAVGAVQIAPTSAISSFTTISTTAPISDGIRTARIAFDESANTLAIDNVALIPLDSSGGVNCAAVGEYHVANAGTFGGGGGGGGGGWGTFWGIEMGTCVYCQLPEFNTGMEPALTNEYIVAFIWEGVVWLWTLLQAFLCLFLNFVTCILWRLVAIIYNIFMASYAAIMLVVNLAIGWFQWLLEGLYAAFLALMYFYIDVWVIGRGIVEWFLAGIYGAFLALMQFNVDVWVGGRNIIGWLIDGTVTGFWNLAQWSVNTTAYAIQYLAYMLMYSLGGVGYLWQFLLWVMATLWGGVMFILSSLWGFSSLVLTISNTLWGIITAIGEVLSRDPQGIEEWAQNTDLNSFALAMFFLGIKFYDWSMATLRLISAIYLVLGIYGIYVGIKVLKEWDRILPN
jgi:hypothetical protein